ncbi:hypothetical protein QQ045_024724 [Rhodiola kirilowii]
MAKLDLLKAPLRRWNKKVFGNVNEKLSSLKAELKCIREMPRSEDLIKKETELITQLDEWLVGEEQMWHQRSRVQWLREGDNNTSFFHHKANARRKINTIAHLRNSDGVLYHDQASLKAIAVNYFKQLFASCVLNSGVIPENFNDTLLVLIPKQKKTVEKMEDLRPISLTSVVSTVVAKVMVNRLQCILPEVVSIEQSAFIKSRLITDNFIIAHECSHFLKNNKRGATVYESLKLDMSKAYDPIEWNFIEALLL